MSRLVSVELDPVVWAAIHDGLDHFQGGSGQRHHVLAFRQLTYKLSEADVIAGWQLRKMEEQMAGLKLGEKVHYVSKTGSYECAATISATTKSLFRPNVVAGHLPDLTDDNSVHLVVLTPGTPGEVSESTLASHPELARPGRPNAPAGSTYAEWNIPFDPSGMQSGSWHLAETCLRGL